MSTNKLTTKVVKQSYGSSLKHAIEDCDDKKECCDVEKYMFALAKHFYSDLVVSAYAVPGLEHLLKHEDGVWSGSLIVLLESIISRLPKINNYTVLKAETAQEAQDLVLSGKAVFDITPTILFPNVVDGDLSYVAVSKTPTDKLILATVAKDDVGEACAVGTLSFAFDQPTTLNEVFDTINGFGQPTTTIVTTKSLYAAYLTYILGTDNPVIWIEEDVIPKTSAELFTLINENAADGVCNAAYLGPYLPLYCAELPLPVSEDVKTYVIELTAEEKAQGYGWAIAKYNARWQVWLQFVIDVLVKCGDYNADKECVALKLTAPPPFYSLCQSYIPRSAPGDLLLPDLRCSKPHKVVQNGAGCATINW